MNVIIAVAVSVRMKVTVNVITATPTLDSNIPELSDIPLPVKYNKAHVIHTNKITCYS